MPMIALPGRNKNWQLAYWKHAGKTRTVASASRCCRNSTSPSPASSAVPLEQQVARQLVADLAQWRLHTPQANDLLQAIDFQQVYQIAFWDALVLQSATSLGCRYLLSEDFNHRQLYGTVQVINPFTESA